MAQSIVIRQYVGGQWVCYAAPAAQVLLPGGASLADYVAAREVNAELVTITHNLGGYPLVLLLSLQYGAGMGGAGDGPAGGTDPVQYPCRAVYHSQNELTVYTLPRIANLGAKTLTRISPYEYLVTFDGISADSMYVKLLLNMGNTGDAAPVTLTMRKQVES